MSAGERLSNKEYEKLALEYEKNPPKLSGNPGFLTNLREQSLVMALLPPDVARIVNQKAKTLSQSPSEVIKYAVTAHLVENA